MYKIEITAETLAELSGKVLSLASKLMTGTAAEGWSAPKATADVVVEVAKAAPVDPTPAPKSAPVAEVSESQPTTTEPSSTTADVEELSFETDVTPVVLAVVQAKGKPAVEEILSQFGVARASQLDPARWPELVAALKDQL
jgi:hypothetical protein